MSRVPMYDPMTSDARSSLIAGLTEACNKISGVLDMKVGSFTNLPMPELYISEDDRFRIYQVPLGNKLWLSEPAPIIKKNGDVITPEVDGFAIDYLGGSVVFEDAYRLTEWDVLTADATYIIDGSEKINTIIEKISDIEAEAGKNKGAFEDIGTLESAYPTGSPGDFAIISSENAIYIWDDAEKKWVNANAKIDLEDYFTKEEINELLNQKQDTIIKKETEPGGAESATDYFYSGDKTWINLLAKIKSCALSGLVTNDDSQVEETDTLLAAIGKLQAQINGFIHPIIGSEAPTTSTVGVVGQDYINTSNGDKYRLVSIEDTTYNWQKYGKSSVENFTVSIPVSAWSNGTCTVTASEIQSGTDYTYFVGPSDSSYKDYNESGIYANDITENSKITFNSSEIPTVDITVDICKISGSTNGGKVYNVGGGGGPSKDAVTVSGGGHITMEDVFGEPPYDIEFTSEEPEDFTAKDIVYDGTISGLDASNVQLAIDELSERKTAYEYAKAGGYTGTEEEFQTLMGISLPTINNKQNKLTGTAGQVVGFGSDGAAVAVSGWSNPNLLDNWYFPDPVNQLEQEEYTTPGYTIDRWKIPANMGATVKITDSGLDIKRTTDTRIIFRQILAIDERVYSRSFAGREVTLSAFLGQEFRSATMTIPTSPDSAWYPGGTAGAKVNDMYIRLAIDVNSSKGTFEFGFDVYVSTGESNGGIVTAVKLEYGPQQTLARQDAGGNWVLNDPPPDKTLELLKCQEYQIAVYAKQSYSMLGFAYGFTESMAYAFIPIPCNLRATPTAVTSGSFRLYNLTGNSIPVSSISFDQWATNGVRLTVNTTSANITPGAIYQLRADNNPNAFILLDANL